MTQRRRRHRDRDERRPNRYWIGWSLLALVGLMAISEAAARMLGPQLPQWLGSDHSGVVMSGHPTRLWGMQPGVKDNVGTVATINSIGLRGEEPQLPRPQDTERVLVLGDSTFFGHGVADNETLHSQLASDFQSAGIEADVINAGIPGYSTEQMQLWLADEGWALEPTLLVVGCLWSDSNWDAFHDADLLRSRRFARYNPLAHSSAFRLLVGWLAGPLTGGPIVVWSQKDEWPTEGVRRVPVEPYARNLVEIGAEAASRNIGVVFVAPVPARRVRAGAETQPHPWDPYFEAQRQAVHAMGAILVELAPVFRKAYDAAIVLGSDEEAAMKSLFSDDVHPTAEGHRLIGASVAKALLDARWPTQRLLAGPAEDWDSSSLETIDAQWQEEAQSNNPMSPHAQLFAGVEVSTDWTVKGEVSDLKMPIRVEIQEPDGRVVGALILMHSKGFQIPIRASSAQVRVVAMGAEGGRLEADARPDDGPVILSESDPGKETGPGSL